MKEKQIFEKLSWWKAFTDLSTHMSVNFCMFAVTAGQFYGKDLLLLYVLVMSELFRSDAESKCDFNKES